jgi:hypothetical protein
MTRSGLAMSRHLAPRESQGSRAAAVKYGLIVAVLSAATLTVALAIAARLTALPPGFASLIH